MGIANFAIAGLGITPMGRIYGRSAASFAAEAIDLACADAGIGRGDIDGLLINSPGALGPFLQWTLGLRDLRLLSEIQQYGSSASAMIQYAGMAVASGMASVVVCVFADAPLQAGVGAGASYAARRPPPKGVGGITSAAGYGGANPRYAMAARRHMETYGTTTEHFGAVAVAQRQWAAMNPHAQLRDPITLEDHRNSRWIAEPLRLLDCCLVSNGGVAVIVTTPERAADLAQPQVHVLGWGQAHPGTTQERGSQFGLVSGAVSSSKTAFGMAGIGVEDVDVLELYDCYTYTVIVSLEDYGFCEKGEGGPLAASGVLAPGGPLPCNTGGGELSGYYMWGMTPLSEAVIQARGQGGERQVPDAEVVLVSGNGGILDFHSTLVLSPERRS
ncbi:MAG: thiolase family protein [Acidimicrobiales bacterium]